jgi:anti-anti-sigma factor
MCLRGQEQVLPVSDTVQIGPLSIDIHADETVLRFLSTDDRYMAVPPDLESDLKALVGKRPEAFEQRKVFFDLEGVEGLSSLQLGIMVTVHRALKSYAACTLRSVSEQMGRLLEVTRLGQLFPVEKD